MSGIKRERSNMELLIYTDKSEFLKYTESFEYYLEPYIKLFDEEVKKQSNVGKHREAQEYSIYMRWPIRKLEYSYCLNNSFNILKKGMRTLDAGCGITPLARVFAQKEYEAYGIDFREEIIALLKDKESLLYDSPVNYSCQNLTKLGFKDEKTKSDFKIAYEYFKKGIVKFLK